MGKSLIIKGADFSQNALPSAIVLQEYGLFDGMFMKYPGTIISTIEDVSDKNNGCYCMNRNVTLNGYGMKANLAYVVVSKGIDVQNAVSIKITIDNGFLTWGYLNNYDWSDAFPAFVFFDNSGNRIISYIAHNIKTGATQEQLETIEQDMINNNCVWFEPNIKEITLDVPTNAKYFKMQQKDIYANQNLKIQLIGFPD